MPSCVACGSPHPDAARFCPRCGTTLGGGAARAASPQATPTTGAPDAARATMPAAMPRSPFRICAHCGANVPPVLQACGACDGPVSSAISIPYPPEGLMFVQVRLTLKCAQCGTKSPIDTPNMSGRYFCFGCGRDQGFDTDLWKERLIRIANIVGDGFWTNLRVYPPWPPITPEEDWLEDQDGWDDVAPIMPNLMQNFLPKIGLERPRLTMEQEGTVFGAGGIKTASYDVAYYPGHPLCAGCLSPVEVFFPRPGAAQVVCRACQVNETHVASPELLGECPELVAAVAPDLVEGRASVRVEQRGGTAALAILCPHCGSPITPSGADRVVTCTFCRTSSVLPERVTGAAGKPPAPSAWWMVLRAPCSLRVLLGQPGAGRHCDDD